MAGGSARPTAPRARRSDGKRRERGHQPTRPGHPSSVVSLVDKTQSVSKEDGRSRSRLFARVSRHPFSHRDRKEIRYLLKGSPRRRPIGRNRTLDRDLRDRPAFVFGATGKMLSRSKSKSENHDDARRSFRLRDAVAAFYRAKRARHVSSLGGARERDDRHGGRTRNHGEARPAGQGAGALRSRASPGRKAGTPRFDVSRDSCVRIRVLTPSPLLTRRWTRSSPASGTLLSA